jgi:aconitate hydratase
MQRISRNFSKQANPFESLKTKLTVGGKTNGLYSLSKLGDSRVEKLPYSVRVLLESAIRNCDNFSVTE